LEIAHGYYGKDPFLRFVTLQREGYTEPALLNDEEVIGLQRNGFPDLLSVIVGAADALDRVARWAYHPPGGERFDLAAVRLAPPIPRPPKIICIGLNYRDHAAESGQQVPEAPAVFAKFPTALIGHGRAIVLPRASTQPDYEAELAVVIGRGGRNIAEERWQQHVFGYTILNDVSARDWQNATSQWMIGKNFDTFAPIGPAIVTPDEIPDPHDLDITLTLSGSVMQKSNTRNMIFRVPWLISYLSRVFTLEPGDIIATGTPAGVGFARKPPRWLKSGDECRITIQRVGELVNPVIGE
jgi:2-keto-4-pentenoate hydratase/2-oxohepta-3-ene-1,7-dioic acid hydratase in catechol pathway